MSALLLPLTVAVLGLTARSMLRTSLAVRHVAQVERAAVEVLRALAGELAAGTTPLQALRSVVETVDAGAAPPGRVAGARVRATLSAAAAATDEPAAAAALRMPGDPVGLTGLSAALAVSAATGAPLADLLGRLATAATRTADDSREVRSVLAGPRTTARLLAGLPVLGLLLAGTTGAHPLGFLLGQPAGRVCLLAGVALDAAGLLWIERLARGARS